MRLKEEFATVYQNDGSITVSTNTNLFSGMIKGNKVASMIIKCLENDTSVEEITNVICKSFDADPAIVKTDVESVIEKLRTVNALNE